ncbi:P-loop containing nucleoside triphosphate hydrolase protein [Scleroderma citrinum]
MAETPTRRSKRFQPLVTHTHPTAWSSRDTSTFWASQPCHTRLSVPDDYDVLREDESWRPTPGMHTAFYTSFARVKIPTKPVSRRAVAQRKPNSTRGANEDKEEFRVGDTVCIETGLMSKGNSVAVIVAMWELTTPHEDKDDGSADPGPMFVRVHWFERPSELPRVRPKREHYDNEVYYTLDAQAVLPTFKVIRRCSVSAEEPSQRQPQTPKPRSRSCGRVLPAPEEDPTTFYCRFAMDPRKGIYYEFDWETHRSSALACPVEDQVSGKQWTVTTEVHSERKRLAQTKRRRLRRTAETEGSDVGSEYHDPAHSDNGATDDLFSLVNDVDSEIDIKSVATDDTPKTPSRKRKRSAPSSPSKGTTTPRKPRRTKLAAPTPHSKAALRARARSRKAPAVRLPPPDLQTREHYHQLENLSEDPWLRAMHVLHVAARPDMLPCRGEEFNRVLRTVEELLEEGSGGCVYISGVPGTGKTATVHAVIRELKRMAETGETNPFTYVEINGLKIPEPSAAYNLLWETVSGHDIVTDGHLRVSSKEALKQLSRHFSTGFRHGPGGHACVVLMDELDQLVTTKQDVVYNFFNWPTLVGSKLVVIAVANTMDLPERVMSGRVRSRLGMTRINFQPYTTPQLEEIVRTRLNTAASTLPPTKTYPPAMTTDAIRLACMKVASISGDARRVLDVCRRAVELARASSSDIEARDVQAALAAMQKSPTAAFVAGCSLHEQIMLAAMVRCVKREGVEEIRWGKIQDQHITYTPILATSISTSVRIPTPSDLTLVLDSLVCSRAILIEDGPAATRNNKPAAERRVMMNLEMGEVERVLGELGGTAWKQALAVSG